MDMQELIARESHVGRNLQLRSDRVVQFVPKIMNAIELNSSVVFT